MTDSITESNAAESEFFAKNDPTEEAHPEPEDLPFPLTVELQVEDPRALFMRMGLVSGEADDGTKVELDITITSGALIFARTTPDGERTVHTLSTAVLLQRWARALDRSE